MTAAAAGGVAAGVGTLEGLHNAISWALEEGFDDYSGFNHMGVGDDWITPEGNLDFLLIPPRFLLLPVHLLSLKKACLSDGISRCLVDMELETQRVQTRQFLFFCQIGTPCTTKGFVTSRSCAAVALSLSLSNSAGLVLHNVHHL